MLPVEAPFKTYTGLDGKPLNNGFVYFGLPAQDPTSHPVTVYWDAAGTIPAAQPLRTVNGYIMNAGTPANVFFAGSYSELVKDSKGRQVFYSRTSDEFSIATVVSNFVSGLVASTGSSLIGFLQSGVGAIARTAQGKLRETVSVKDFGAAGDGATDDTAAIQAAINSASANGCVHFPTGKYKVTSSVALREKVSLRGDGKATSEIYFSLAGDFTLQGSAGGHIGAMTIAELGFTDQGGSGRFLLNLRYAIGIGVVDCVVYNGNVSVSGFNYITFDRCDLYTGQLYADHPDVNGISEALKVSKCKGSGYRIIVRDTADVMIDHTHLLGSTAQIWIQRGDQVAGFYPPVWIDHCVVDSGDDEGIILSGVAPHIDGCFVSCGRANNKNGIVLTDCTEGSIVGTMARFNGGNGLFMRVCNDITVESSAFNDNKVSGVSIGDSSNLRFIGNGMTNAPVWYGGSYVQQTGLADDPGNCTSITVAGNQMAGNAIGPFYLPSATNTIHSNEGFNENIFRGTVLRDSLDNNASVGSADFRWSVMYAATGTIATSDERVKEQRAGGIDAAVLRAWARVQYAQFKFTDAIEKKGDGARWHFGLIAQRVKEAFESEGLDPFAYGLLCYDDWGDGNRYGIRYEEALALECAYLRSRLPA